jgi:hypothetical protein
MTLLPKSTLTLRAVWASSHPEYKNPPMSNPTIGIAINAGANQRDPLRLALIKAAMMNVPEPTAAPRMPPLERV